MGPGRGACDNYARVAFVRCGPRRSQQPIRTSCGVRGARRPSAAFQGAETTMPVFLRTFAIAAAVMAVAAALLMPEGAAFAGLGQATPWQIGLQEPATPVMEDVYGFHTAVLVIITAITLFVLALLVIVMVRFNAAANPTPSRTTHNTVVEVLWTVIPVIILVIIALPSFRILFYQLNTPPADLTIKATE